MNWDQFLGRKLQITIFCPDSAFLMDEITGRNIELNDIAVEDMTFTAVLSRRNLKAITEITEKHGCKITDIRYLGIYWKAAAFLRRPVLTVSILLIVFAVFFLSGRVFWIQVEGNEQVPANVILEQAASAGIKFGTARRNIRSETVKNDLLSSIRQLQWVGVNTTGSVATIQVRERENCDLSARERGTVSSIVAATDGVIVSLTAMHGTPVCTPGQAVKAGQLLVSGYTDCGIKTNATQAEAEIIAQTRRTIRAVLPCISAKRADVKKETKRYSLLVGKKLINFYEDSGILDTTCVKIYEENYLTLPGGFQLPLAIVTERLIIYDNQSLPVSETNMQGRIERYIDNYLETQMVAGQVISNISSVYTQDNCIYLTGEYLCLEMIGQVQYEENIFDDGEND